MTSTFDKQYFGQGGALFAPTADTLYSGQFCMIQVVTATKFKTFTWTKLGGYPSHANPEEGSPIHNATSGSAFEFPAGTVIYGQISSFTLHSGAVLAYSSVHS
jgi:hypothetical protein